MEESKLNAPRISIVTPSFNQAHYLEETICSVLDQGYPNLEYIIIDGGSSDGSQEIINKYKSHLSYWVSEPDSGHADAIQKGFAKSTGQIMGWINSDDLYFPWCFRTLKDVFTTMPNVHWMTGMSSYYNHSSCLTNVRICKNNIYDVLIGHYSWIQQESTFWTRTLWEKAGATLNRNLQFMVDGELWMRFFQFEHLYHINTLLGGFRNHGENRSTHNRIECDREMQMLIEEYSKHASMETLDRASRFLFYSIGTGHKESRANPLAIFLKKLIRRIHPAIFEETGYHNISWDSKLSMWVESRDYI